MQCPLDGDVELKVIRLETDLVASQCDRCMGIWISSLDYWTWLEQHGDPTPPHINTDPPLPVADSSRTKLCPDCKHYLTRYKVWPDLQFWLDHCDNCNGVWFDQNEWQALRARNLHDKVNTFFTRPWQLKLKAEEARRKLEDMYTRKFGQEHYARLQEVRAWLDQHPQRLAMLAFLQTEDPYKI